MIKELKLEWIKVRNYRVFWILFGMYMLAVIIICFGGMFFLEYLKRQGADFNGIDPTFLPIYDFPDIYQNTTYLAKFLRVLIAFIIIVSVGNDLTYNTLRQNIIDGVSKKQYLIGKLSFISMVALFSTAILWASCLVNGSIYSHVWGVDYIFDELEFVGAYFYDLIVYSCLAFLLTLIIKKPGFVIIALFLYTMMFEPIAATILENAPFFRDGVWPYITPFFPVHSLNDLIPSPFPKYIFRENCR